MRIMSNSQAAVEPKPIPPEIDRWNWGAFLLNWISPTGARIVPLA